MQTTSATKQNSNLPRTRGQFNSATHTCNLQDPSVEDAGASKSDVRGSKRYKHAFSRCKKLLDTNNTNLITYGPNEVNKAVQWGAVEHLFVAGTVNKRLASTVARLGGDVFQVDPLVDPVAHQFVSLFTGVLAVLRFPLPNEDASAAVTTISITAAPATAGGTNANASTAGTWTRCSRARTITAKRVKGVHPSHAHAVEPPVTPTPVAPTPTTSSLLRAVLTRNETDSTAMHATDARHVSVDDDEVEDEMEALVAIYPALQSGIGTEFLRIGHSRTCLLATHLGDKGAAVCLRIVLPPAYPAVGGAAEVLLEARRGIDESVAAAVLAAAVLSSVEEEGAPALFAIATSVEAALETAAATAGAVSVAAHAA